MGSLRGSWWVLRMGVVGMGAFGWEWNNATRDNATFARVVGLWKGPAAAGRVLRSVAWIERGDTA